MIGDDIVDGDGVAVSSPSVNEDHLEKERIPGQWFFKEVSLWGGIGLSGGHYK